MEFEEHFFWRYQQECRETEQQAQEALRRRSAKEVEQDARVEAELKAYQKRIQPHRNQELVGRYHKNMRIAYELARSCHFDVMFSEEEHPLGLIRFKTDRLLFSVFAPEEKKAFLQLLAESELFFLEQDEECVLLYFYFELCDVIAP